jgi:hypothetical protein
LLVSPVRSIRTLDDPSLVDSDEVVEQLAGDVVAGSAAVG